MKKNYKRIILKIMVKPGSRTEGAYSCSIPENIYKIKAVSDMGIGKLVVGGGNIFRGLQGSEKGIDRTTGDSMGMLLR